MISTKKPGLAEIFQSKKLLILLLMGFASGLPFPLTHGTIQAWMTQSGLTRDQVGEISTLIGYPFALKIFWAPFLDRLAPPFFGLRRGWLFIWQVILIATMVGIGFINPQADLQTFVIIALVMSFASASQDIVIDAYRTEVLDESERGLATPTAILGYRVALVFAASLALIWAKNMGWQFSYTVMAGLMMVGLVTTFSCEEPKIQRQKLRTFADSFVKPLLEFIKRPAAFEILAFVILYKFGEVLATSLTSTFLLELTYSLEDIGYITKGAGLIASIAGVTAGGVILIKLSMKQALWLFGILQSAATLGYYVLAISDKNLFLMGTCIATENFCLGMASSAFTAFLMGLCNTNFTATQYALFTSLIALVHTQAPTWAAKIVDQVGWPQFYLLCILTTIPGLLLLLRFDIWQKNVAKSATA